MRAHPAFFLRRIEREVGARSSGLSRFEKFSPRPEGRRGRRLEGRSTALQAPHCTRHTESARLLRDGLRPPQHEGFGPRQPVSKGFKKRQP
jgi:hypothetical protein